jgi:hypothetical protein
VRPFEMLWFTTLLMLVVDTNGFLRRGHSVRPGNAGPSRGRPMTPFSTRARTQSDRRARWVTRCPPVAQEIELSGDGRGREGNTELVTA